MDVDTWENFHQDEDRQNRKFENMFKTVRLHCTTKDQLEKLLDIIEHENYINKQREWAARKLLSLVVEEFDVYYLSLSIFERENLRQRILLSIKTDMDNPIREKLSKIIIKVIKKIIDECGSSECSDLLELLVTSGLDNNPTVGRSSIFIFSHLWSRLKTEQFFKSDFIRKMFKKSLAKDAEHNVKYQAVFALFTFIVMDADNTELQNQFAPMLPDALEIINKNKYNVYFTSMMKVLKMLVETNPAYVKSEASYIFKLCMNIFADENTTIKFLAKDIALDVMVKIHEIASEDFEPLYISYLNEVTGVILNQMEKFEDNWIEIEVLRDDDIERDNMIERWPLYHIARKIDGNDLFPVVINKIYEKLAYELDTDWKHVYTGLNAISAITETYHLQMDVHGSQELLRKVMMYSKHKNPYVRFAAYSAIRCISRYCKNIYTQRLCNRVVYKLLKVIWSKENDHPRNLSIAINALSVYIDNCTMLTMRPILEKVFPVLYDIIEHRYTQMKWNNVLLLHEVVLAILVIYGIPVSHKYANCSLIVKYLKSIIIKATTDNLRILRFKCVLCISVIAKRRRELHYGDIVEVMKMFARRDCKDQITIGEDEKLMLMLSWKMIIQIIGYEFARYLKLKFVMDLIIDIISSYPKIVDEEVDEENSDEFRASYSHIIHGKSGIGSAHRVGRSDCQYILITYELVEIFASEFPHQFFPHVEAIYPLINASLSSYSEKIRTCAADLIPRLIWLTIKSARSRLNIMWNCTYPVLLEAIQNERDESVYIAMNESLERSVKIITAHLGRILHV